MTRKQRLVEIKQVVSDIGVLYSGSMMKKIKDYCASTSDIDDIEFLKNLSLDLRKTRKEGLVLLEYIDQLINEEVVKDD